MIKAVVIDLDDTLCLTEAACFELENEVLAKMGRSPMGRDIHISTWGQPLYEAILLRSPGLDVEEFKRCYAPTIKEFTDSGRLDAIPEDNFETLDELIRQGKLVMVLTSRTHGELSHLLAPDHLLSSRVKAFYYKDNMQYHKPDPRAFNELLHDHNLLPEEVVYIGDSLGDARAAKEAGLHFVASLESKLKSPSDFEGMPVDAFITRFPGVLEVLKKL